MPYKDPAKVREANRKSYRRHRAARLEAKKRWRENNPAYMAEWRKANPEKKYPRKTKSVYKREWHLANRYGLTPEQVDQMILDQDGRCLVCETLFDYTELALNPVVDHSHATGAVRGILHRKCNAALGVFADDPAVLRNAAAYLEINREQRTQE